jgi:uncharacterized membrane protein YkoI
MSNTIIQGAKRFVIVAAAAAILFSCFAAAGSTDAYAAKDRISMKQAKKIAVKDAHRKYSKVDFTKARTEYDDGIKHYDIEFTYKTSKYRYEYDYEISMSGDILESGFDREPISRGKFIGVAKAKSIALKKAKLTASQVTFTSAHREYDDGRYIYDIEFFHGNWEYSFEIHAKTGRILEWDRDYEGGGWDD